MIPEIRGHPPERVTRIVQVHPVDSESSFVKHVRPTNDLNHSRYRTTQRLDITGNFPWFGLNWIEEQRDGKKRKLEVQRMT